MLRASEGMLLWGCAVGVFAALPAQPRRGSLSIVTDGAKESEARERIGGTVHFPN